MQGIVVMAARPGRVIREIAVNEPFPRDNRFRVSPRFSLLCAEVLEALTEAEQQGKGVA